MLCRIALQKQVLKRTMLRIQEEGVRRLCGGYGQYGGGVG